MTDEEVQQMFFEMNVCRAEDDEERDYILMNYICWPFDREEYLRQREERREAERKNNEFLYGSSL